MKLLLATDGSSFSAAATQAVIAEVKRDGAEIRAIHVVDADKESLSQMTALDTEVMNAPAQRRSAEALVEATAEVLRAEGFKTTTIVDWGDPRSGIIEVAKQWGADLIVLGAQGRTGLKGFFMGSVSDAVAHHAPCSVEIVRVPEGRGTPQNLRILLAMDDSEFSEAAANAVVTHVKPEGTEVKLLSVLDPYTVADPKRYPDFAGAVAELRDRAVRKLLKTAEKLQMIGFNVTNALVEEGDPRDVILDSAGRWRTGLIVVGSHGRKGIKGMLMGSVADAVSRHAACSVEIVRFRSNA
jgi:nucleotide-binding universal stress UspA family protein